MKILTAPQSGSQAGTTASRNRFGQYLRSRAVPVQPRTPKQTYIRAQFTIGSSGWRSLTDPQREAWNTYAEQIQRSDSLGQNYAPTGAELYTGAVVLAESAAVTDAPTLLPTYNLAVIGMTYTDPTPGPEAFTLDLGQTNAENSFIVETSGPISPGVTSAAAVRRWVSLPDDALNQIPHQFAMSASPVAILTQYAFVFPSPLPGQNIWFRFREIFRDGTTNGAVGNRLRQTFRFIVP